MRLDVFLKFAVRRWLQEMFGVLATFFRDRDAPGDIAGDRVRAHAEQVRGCERSAPTHRSADAFRPAAGFPHELGLKPKASIRNGCVEASGV